MKQPEEPGEDDDGWFFLYPWARENATDGRRAGRRHSDRATPDDNPTDDGTEQTDLTEL